MMLTTCSLSIGELRSSNSTSRNHSQAQIKKARHLFAKQGIIVGAVRQSLARLKVPRSHKSMKRRFGTTQ